MFHRPLSCGPATVPGPVGAFAERVRAAFTGHRCRSLAAAGINP